MLLKRHRASPLKALRHLVGLQAQAPDPPYLALLARLDGFALPQLTRLLEHGKVVRMASLRSTLHLMPADEALGLRGVLEPVMKRILLASRGRLLAGVDLRALEANSRRLLLHRPLTHGALGAALQRYWPDRSADALATAARNVLPLTHLPPAGCWGCHVKAQLEVHEACAADRETTIDALVMRYLRAYGPATTSDMSAWSGLTRLGASFERMRPQLVALVGDDGREHFDLPRAPRPAPEIEAPPRLLGPWESLLLSHNDRSRFLRNEHRGEVFTNNGIVRATAWVDGTVAGTWDLADDARCARITISAFQALPRQARETLILEARRILHTVQPQKRHDVAINPVSGGLGSHGRPS